MKKRMFLQIDIEIVPDQMLMGNKINVSAIELDEIDTNIFNGDGEKVITLEINKESIVHSTVRIVPSLELVIERDEVERRYTKAALSEVIMEAARI
jgi:hypothetical protein